MTFAYRLLRFTRPNQMRGADVTDLQRALNHHVSKPGGFTPIPGDGIYGHETNRTYLHVGWDLGFADGSLRKGATVWGQRKVKGTWPRTPRERRTALARRGKPNPFIQPPVPPTPPSYRPLSDYHGIGYFEGKACAAWIAEACRRVRAAGIWHGTVLSGYRTPGYSEHLCFQMCGRPSCPGRCAGRASEHSQLDPLRGAVDTTDPVTFRSECARLGIPLHNALPHDPNHSSYTGH